MWRFESWNLDSRAAGAKRELLNITDILKARDLDKCLDGLGGSHRPRFK